MASAHGPKKELGQHWLRDPEILAEIAEAAELSKDWAGTWHIDQSVVGASSARSGGGV